MSNIFKKILSFIKKKDIKKEVNVEIDPHSLKSKEELMHLQKALNYEKGKGIKGDKIISELTKQIDDEKREKIAEDLTRQKEEFYQKDSGIATSIKQLLMKKKKKKIYVVSYNREKNFGVLKDIGISGNGLISVYIEGTKKPIMSGRTPQDIFRNCHGLKNDAYKGIISINLNNEGDFVENIEQVEVPEVVIDFNNKINILSHDTAPFIERLIEKNNEIDDLFHNLKINERMINELNKDLNLEKKKNEILDEENKSYKSDLSDTLNRTKEIQKNYNRLTRNLSLLEEDNLLYEKFKTKMETAIEKLHKKLAEKVELTTIEEATKEIKKTIEWYEEIKPDVQIISPEKEVIEKPEVELPTPVKP